MDAWLNLPQPTYKATVYRFAHKLPPTEVLEAVEIAQAKIPQGGMDGFKYFCGVCNCMIQEHRIRLSWN
jgi:predicted PP-loop superfamily ATPase